MDIFQLLERNQMSAPLAMLKKRMEEDKAWRKHQRYGSK